MYMNHLSSDSDLLANLAVDVHVNFSHHEYSDQLVCLTLAVGDDAGEGELFLVVLILIY
jgi:hypothetical protein